MKFLRTRRHSEHYKWWVLTCTSLGMLLATVNSGTLIIALPDLERSLHTTLLQLVWVILVYMIVSTVLVLTAGRLSDLFGRKHAYVLGFLVFSAASLGAGFAGSGTQLILWRVLQGVGGAFLFANAAALVTDAFPKHKLGLAMGTNTMVGRGRPGDRAGARRRARRDLVAVGLLVQPAVRARRLSVGVARPARDGGPRRGARTRPARHGGIRRRAHRARARPLEGRPLRLERHARDRGMRRPSCCCRCSS